jgi:hypothetical protein
MTGLRDTGIIYALSYLILAFAGQQSGPQPSKAVCLTQAAVSYAAAPLYVPGVAITCPQFLTLRRCAAAILALNIEVSRSISITKDRDLTTPKMLLKTFSVTSARSPWISRAVWAFIALRYYDH